ncbi:hypothetical protein F2Q69_00062520 [Brassica cretica]|uniref:Uncharacterized protein n=1 Tax=Brassica cretica TaxID=69181 RepID=A0A8S9RI19_BRACR|nr:hypothetical protein F2Q69_00062520 [Brassica cretica]
MNFVAFFIFQSSPAAPPSLLATISVYPNAAPALSSPTPLLGLLQRRLNPKRCNFTETEPSLTPEIVPPPPPRPEPRSTSSLPIPDEDHHRDRDVETSRDQEDQPESRPDAPSRATFLPRRSARVAHAPPPSSTRSARGSHAPPAPTVVRRRRPFFRRR